MPILTGGATSTDLVSIDDVATHLNWNATQKANQQAEMAGFISAVTAVVEGITGPIIGRQFDEWYDGGAATIALYHVPVMSVTTVEESYGSETVWTLSEQPVNQSGLNEYGYTVDLVTGTLVRRFSGVAGRFAPGKRNVHVVYDAGYGSTTSDVPANVRLGALELIRINWQPQQGGNRPGYTSMTGVDEMQVDGSWRMGFFVPNRVMELLAPSRKPFGIA